MTKQILAALQEGFEGPHDGSSYFLDSDGGLRGTLAKVSAEEASRAVGGTSIAAHAHHIRFSLAASAASIAGDSSPRDWNESWTVRNVDETEWDRLRRELDAEYDKLRATIAAHGDSALGAGVGVVAHLAYHVGAIRQKLAV
ncbi:MAG TPA: DinB family protein [Thermoanaerobaculia bacterium]|nr:DinB family protein [Thermoanaerobaculia bacterium]